MAGVKGRSGRKRTSAVLKLIHGTARADRMNPRAPVVKHDLTVADAPEYFDDEQRAEWSRVISLAPAGLLKATDREVVAEFVGAWVEYVRVRMLVRKHGPLIKGAHGAPVVNPLLREEARLAARITRAAGELGFTPSAREKVSSTPPESGNPFDDL